MDDSPPPPYSLYSNSNSGSRFGSQSTTSNFDNFSIPRQSISEYDAASSTGDPTIYTPPYTPDGDRSSHLDSVTDGFENVSSPASTIAASASAYFESRPTLQSPTDTLLVHHVVVTKHTQSSDLPFPEPVKKWLERDVLPQDWETFVNYLIPNHTYDSNCDVADRKLKAELVDERMHRLTLDENDTSRTDLREVDAQLEPLRRSYTEDDSVERDVNAVIHVWNEGFFFSRSIRIEASGLQSVDSTRPVSGSWTNGPAEGATNNQSQVPPCTSRKGFGGDWMRADNSGFHIGKNMVSADHNGFRIGNFLVADVHGLRIGGYTPPHIPRKYHPAYHPELLPAHMPTTLRGRPLARDFSLRMPQRDRSHSTSSSSSSGASSIESAGSLPDYDHLLDTQLPIAKQAIGDWLNHPDQPITKQTVKQISQGIKAANCGNSSFNEAERDALRNEVRDLFKEFKAVKKSQKKAWKAAKRERRSVRREARRTRRAARREAKKAAKREVKAGKMRCSPSIAASPAMPEVPAVHITPRISHLVPPMDGMGWPFMESSQAGNAAKAALLQLEQRRIEAEIIRGEALKRAEETRQKALDQASAARSRAEESRQQVEAKAVIAREKAQVIAALAHERAEEQRQRAYANARIAR